MLKINEDLREKINFCFKYLEEYKVFRKLGINSKNDIYTKDLSKLVESLYQEILHDKVRYFFDKYYDRILMILSRRYKFRKEDIEDSVQSAIMEIFLSDRFITNNNLFENDIELFRFIVTVSKNKLRDMFKKKKPIFLNKELENEVHYPFKESGEEIKIFSTYENIGNCNLDKKNNLGYYFVKNSIDFLSQTLNFLNQREKTIFLLYEIGYSYEDLSRILKVKASTCRVILHRTRKKVNDRFQDNQKKE